MPKLKKLSLVGVTAISTICLATTSHDQKMCVEQKMGKPAKVSVPSKQIFITISPGDRVPQKIKEGYPTKEGGAAPIPNADPNIPIVLEQLPGKDAIK